MTPKAKKLFLISALVAVLLALAATPALAGEGFGVISTFGKEVNKTKVEEKEKGAHITEAEEDVCTAASGNVCQQGSEGSGSGQFNRPRGIAVSEVGTSKGDVYVADTRNDRVEVFSAVGMYLSEFAVSKPEGIAVDNSGKSASEDPSVGDVYVLTSKGGVDKFSATGTLIFNLSPVLEVEGIATDPSGDVWVVGRAKSNAAEAFVQEFSNAAENKPDPPVGISTEEERARGLAVDSEDNLYISGLSHQIYKFSKTGAPLGFVCERIEGREECANGVAIEPGTNDLLADQGTSVAQYGPFGVPFAMPIFKSKLGILTNGQGIAVNAASHQVYVVDEAGFGEGGRVVTLERGETPETPETLPATKIEAESAILHGKLKSLSTEYYFEYNTGGICTGGSRTPSKPGAPGEAVEAEVKELEPGAHYTFCLVAEDKFGASEPGLPLPLDVPVSPPVIVHESVSNITPEEGEFSAMIKPENEETTYWFEYSTEGSASENKLENAQTDPGAPFPTLPPELGEQPVTVGGAQLGDVTGTYYYRVVAENATGKTEGPVQAYTKLPIVTGEQISVLTSTSVKLTADVNPDFQETKYRFEYATGKEGKDGEEVLKDGEGTVAPNSAGTLPANQAPLASHCQDGTLPTPSPGGSFTCDDGSQPKCENGVTPTPDGTSLLCPIPIGVEVLSLQPGQTYYYRVTTENETTENPANANAGLPATGTIEHFKPFAAPDAVTIAGAQNITPTSATLSGEVNPNGARTTYHFAYINEAGYQEALKKGAANPYTEGEATESRSLPASEESLATGPVAAEGLLPGITYHYALIATNQYGIQSTGLDHTFTTQSASPPLVSTGAANGISQNTATLYGTVTTNGLQTSYGFEIATEPGNYGPATGLGAIGGALTEGVHVTLGELEPGTTYYYRVTATNADGTIQGQPGTFTTPGFPTLISPPASPAQFAFTKVAFPTETGTTGTGTKALTRAQKLAKALKQCRRKRGAKRTGCERTARKRFGPVRRVKQRK